MYIYIYIYIYVYSLFLVVVISPVIQLYTSTHSTVLPGPGM